MPFDAFRGIMAEFAAEENGLMAERQTSNESTVSTTFVIIGISVATAVAIGLLRAWLIRSGIAEQANLLALNATIEAAVRAMPARALRWSPAHLAGYRLFVGGLSILTVPGRHAGVYGLA